MKSTYLAVGPLPPPIGGDTVLFSRMLASPLWSDNGIQLEIVDTSRKEPESRLIRKLDRRDFFNACSFFLQAWRKRKKVDGLMLWANNRFAYTLGLLFILLFRYSHKKVIVKLFGGDFDEEYQRLPGWWRWLIKYGFAKCDHLLPETRHLCRFFREQLALRDEQVIHCPNFLPFTPLPVKQKSQAEVMRAVFVGQIRAEKGIFEILEAMRIEPRLSTTFYGPIFAAERKRFLQELEDLPQARYGGVLAPDHILRELASYDLLLLPSYHPGEGYPAAIVEGFFAAIPVIATQWRMLPELVIEGENGFLVQIKRPEQIAERVAYLLAHPAVYEAMCRQARRSAECYQEERVLGDILLPLLQVKEKRTMNRLQVEKGG